MVIVYHRERIQLEISQSKKYVWQSKRKFGIPVVLSPWSQDSIILLTSVCDNIHGVVLDRKLLQILVFRVFIELHHLSMVDFPSGKSVFSPSGR